MKIVKIDVEKADKYHIFFRNKKKTEVIKLDLRLAKDPIY